MLYKTLENVPRFNVIDLKEKVYFVICWYRKKLGSI